MVVVVPDSLELPDWLDCLVLVPDSLPVVLDCLVLVPDSLPLVPDCLEVLVEVELLVVPLLPLLTSVLFTLPFDPPSLVLELPVVLVPLVDVPDSRDPDPVEFLLPL